MILPDRVQDDEQNVCWRRLASPRAARCASSSRRPRVRPVAGTRRRRYRVREISHRTTGPLGGSAICYRANTA
ncbi:hypothetical protein NJ7G_0982 [Natrinema sp. J7-2]|nr:hypothetical protein NJ7G_0982 [Natrinema sp. J7-2]